MKIKTLQLGIIVWIILLVFGCNKPTAWQQGKPIPKEKIKIGVIHISNPLSETSGYAYAHEQGILAMQTALKLQPDQIIRKLNIYEADTLLVENAIRNCIASGAQIIFATSWGYMDACEKLSAEFPEVIFAHASGTKHNNINFTNYFGRIYQARYLSGIAAGLKTQTGKVGYVGALGKENSEVTGGLNAFALGVEKVNPKAKVYVRVTHSWFDPIEETNAAQKLIKLGCDVIAQHCDTSKPQIEAEKAGVWSIGYNTDMRQEAPKAVITSVIWNWGVYYTKMVKSVIEGVFTSDIYFGSTADGMIGLSPLSGNVAPGTDQIIAAERELLDSGSFDVFEGVLITNDGKRIGEAGKRLDDNVIRAGINWYYRNVVEK